MQNPVEEEEKEDIEAKPQSTAPPQQEEMQRAYVAQRSPNLSTQTPPPCFCCGCGYCCCGWSGTLYQYPQSLLIRSLNCFLRYVYWRNGMYPGGEFNRKGIDKLMRAGCPKQPRAFNRMCKKLNVASGELTREQVLVASSESPAMQIPVIIISPKVVDRVLVYFHGGGYVFGSPKQRGDELFCIAMATHGFATVNVDYRMCPEHTLEQALWDAYDAVLYAQTKFPGKDLYLGGCSAGGNITCTLTSLFRDRLNPSLQATTTEQQMSIAGNVYLTPWLGLELYVGANHPYANNTPLLERSTLMFFYQAVFGPSEQQVEQGLRSERRFNALLAGYHDFPKIVMVSAGCDYLQHENQFAVQVFEEKLGKHMVTHLHYENKAHSFQMFYSVKKMQALVQKIVTSLKVDNDIQMV